MAENNVIYTVVTPDVPKAIPGEQLYVYVPRASFTNPGIAAFDSTQFTIDANGIVSIKNEYVTQNEFNKAQFAISETGGVSIKDDYVKGVMQPTVKLLNDAVETANDTADRAEDAAGRAESKAADAAATADGIDGKATQALTKAQTAETNAGIAKNDAASAVQIATQAVKQVGDKLDKSAIVQEKGTATDKVMSQKSVTDELRKKLDRDDNSKQCVYAVNPVREQEMVKYSEYSHPFSIAYRNENGELGVANATSNENAINLGQLNEKVSRVTNADIDLLFI